MTVFVLLGGNAEKASAWCDRIGLPSGRRLPRRLAESVPLCVIRMCPGEDCSENERLPEGVSVLQRQEPVRRALDVGTVIRALARNGIRSTAGHWRSQGSGTASRQLTVPVFHLEALGVYSSGGRGGPIGRASAAALLPWEEEDAGSRSVLLRRVKREAVRAVYALGLDYGLVTLVSDGSGHPAVVGVEPCPSMTGLIGEAFADGIRRFAEEWTASAASTSQSELLFGMDPEFVLRRPGPNGRIVSADKFLERRGVVGCDSVRIGDRMLYPLAELRPPPAAEPETLFRHLAAAMRLAAERIHDASLEWLAGGMPVRGLALGGHIHVSGVWLNAELLRAMDNYMTLPLVMIEDSTTRLRRPAYGALGDFRRQWHGGFEYRTLPSWIVSPTLAMGVLALARIVCEHYRELRRRPLASEEMQIWYYEGNKDRIESAVTELWSDLERTAAYARYAPYLVKLKKRIVERRSWNEQQDLRKLWKIVPSMRTAIGPSSKS